MRIQNSHSEFLKKTIKMYLADATVYLIGSRTNDRLRGGDIDILVIANRQLTSQEKRNIKIAFYKKYGEQKIDIVSFNKSEKSGFKDLVLIEGVEL